MAAPTRILPYEARPQGRAPARLAKIALFVTLIYPFLPHLGVTVTFLVAWAALGHPPRACFDDPKCISPLVDAPYVVTAWMLMTWPPGCLGSIVVGMTCIRIAVRSCVIGPTCIVPCTAGLVGVHAIALMLFCVDPGGLLYWYFD